MLPAEVGTTVREPVVHLIGCVLYAIDPADIVRQHYAGITTRTSACVGEIICLYVEKSVIKDAPQNSPRSNCRAAAEIRTTTLLVGAVVEGAGGLGSPENVWSENSAEDIDGPGELPTARVRF